MIRQTQVQDGLLKLLADPQLSGILSNNHVLFLGVATVSVLPGWRTRQDYSCEVQLQPYYKDKDEFEVSQSKPLIVSAFPMVEGQVLDLQFSKQRQFQLLADIAGAYAAAGQTASAQLLLDYTRRQQQDVATRTTLPVLVPSSDGAQLTYRFDPELQAIANPASFNGSPGYQLHANSVPILVLMSCLREDLKCYNKVGYRSTVRWVPTVKRHWAKKAVDWVRYGYTRGIRYSGEERLQNSLLLDGALSRIYWIRNTVNTIDGQGSTRLGDGIPVLDAERGYVSVARYGEFRNRWNTLVNLIRGVQEDTELPLPLPFVYRTSLYSETVKGTPEKIVMKTQKVQKSVPVTPVPTVAPLPSSADTGGKVTQAIGVTNPAPATPAVAPAPTTKMVEVSETVPVTVPATQDTTVYKLAVYGNGFTQYGNQDKGLVKGVFLQGRSLEVKKVTEEYLEMTVDESVVKRLKDTTVPANVAVVTQGGVAGSPATALDADFTDALPAPKVADAPPDTSPAVVSIVPSTLVKLKTACNTLKQIISVKNFPGAEEDTDADVEQWVVSANGLALTVAAVNGGDKVKAGTAQLMVKAETDQFDAGIYDVSVVSFKHHLSATLKGGLTIKAPSAASTTADPAAKSTGPAIDAIYPTHGYIRASTTVLVTGSGYTGTDGTSAVQQVLVQGRQCRFQVLSAKQLIAIIPPWKGPNVTTVTPALGPAALVVVTTAGTVWSDPSVAPAATPSTNAGAKAIALTFDLDVPESDLTPAVNLETAEGALLRKLTRQGTELNFLFGAGSANTQPAKQ